MEDLSHSKRRYHLGTLHIAMHTTCVWLQEDQKFLSQRVEGLQGELEVFAERSRQESVQLTMELQGTQQVGKQRPAGLPVAARASHWASVSHVWSVAFQSHPASSLSTGSRDLHGPACI